MVWQEFRRRTSAESASPLKKACGAFRLSTRRPPLPQLLQLRVEFPDEPVMLAGQDLQLSEESLDRLLRLVDRDRERDMALPSPT